MIWIQLWVLVKLITADLIRQVYMLPNSYDLAFDTLKIKYIWFLRVDFEFTPIL